ncbi:hypothetical protein AAW14_00955 [Streptomyces hygroscopicus]|nr:hypothetical protein [Streptomyces hygroscopicus]
MTEDHYGDGLRAARIRAGLTQEELARRVGLSVRTVRHLEHGHVRNPRQETLIRMSRVVGYDLAAALGLGCEADTKGETPGISCEIRLLGPLTVLCAGLPVAMPLKQRTLLGLLVVQPDQTVGHEEISDLLWGGEAPPTHQNLVHTYVARLRRIIETGHGRDAGSRRISTVYGGYVFNSDGIRLDLHQFEERVGRAVRTASADPVAALELYNHALSCWQTRPLQDLPQLWQHPAVVRVAQRYIDVVIEFADLALRLNRPAYAVPRLTVASHEEPLHEELQSRVMLALAGCGRRAAALRQFADLRARLKKELGVEPSSEVWLARQTILAQDGDGRRVELPGKEPAGGLPRQDSRRPSPAYDVADESARESGVATPVAPPYRPRGLAQPAQLPPVPVPFVGRHKQLTALDEILARRRDSCDSVGIAVIHGPSEIGKTSLAVRWAHRRHEAFPDGQLYADLQGGGDAPDGPAHVRTVLTRFLRSLGVPDDWMPATREEGSALFRSLLAGGKFLVVLDGVSDPAQVRALMPGTPGNLVLVTSKHPLMDLVTRNGATPIALDPLSATEAHALLKAYVGPERTAAEPDATDELVALCRQLPLRLRSVAARLATNPRLTVRAVVAELAHQPGANLPQDGQRPRREGDPQARRRAAGPNGRHGR